MFVGVSRASPAPPPLFQYQSARPCELKSRVNKHSYIIHVIWSPKKIKKSIKVLKRYYDENRIFPIPAFLKHKQLNCARRKMLFTYSNMNYFICTSHHNLILSTGLIMWIGHRFERQPFVRANRGIVWVVSWMKSFRWYREDLERQFKR